MEIRQPTELDTSVWRYKPQGQTTGLQQQPRYQTFLHPYNTSSNKERDYSGCQQVEAAKLPVESMKPPMEAIKPLPKAKIPRIEYIFSS